jgi:hypothetical protein
MGTNKTFNISCEIFGRTHLSTASEILVFNYCFYFSNNVKPSTYFLQVFLSYFIPINRYPPSAFRRPHTFFNI